MTSSHRQQIGRLVAMGFGSETTTVGAIDDINRGRGVFSAVLRVELQRPPDAGREAGPASVVAKLPVEGPNGVAARTSGAYRREAMAYEDLLARSTVRAPLAYAVHRPSDDECELLLEDLSDHRAVDQLDGLSADDAAAVAVELARFHLGWREDRAAPATLDVRRDTIAVLDEDALRRGLVALDSVWGDVLSDGERRAFADLVAARPALVDAFAGAERVTLCHGDPRADNLVFDPAGRPVLFDWQQMAVQFGEADVAWLAATSLTIDVRRRLDADLVEAYGGDFGRYRLGMALPGLAVLLLAQRTLPDQRSRRFVAASLHRIAAAVGDLETATIT